LQKNQKKGLQGGAEGGERGGRREETKGKKIAGIRGIVRGGGNRAKQGEERERDSPKEKQVRGAITGKNPELARTGACAKKGNPSENIKGRKKTCRNERIHHRMNGTPGRERRERGIHTSGLWRKVTGKEVGKFLGVGSPLPPLGGWKNVHREGEHSKKRTK